MAAKTSSSVNPNEALYFSEVVVTTSRLFKSENTDSNASQEAMLMRVIPVIIALSSQGLVLNEELKIPLIKEAISSQYPPI